MEIRGPQSEVVSEQLHDKGGVLVTLLTQRVQLSNRIIKRLLRQLTCLLGTVEDLVVEDREVERQSESDGVGGWQLAGGMGARLVVGLEAVVRRLLLAFSRFKLRQVPVVVSFPGGGCIVYIYNKNPNYCNKFVTILWLYD